MRPSGVLSFTPHFSACHYPHLLCERLASLAPRGLNPRRGWPVYSNARAAKRAKPRRGDLSKTSPLPKSQVRSPLRGLAARCKGASTINRLPLRGLPLGRLWTDGHQRLLPMRIPHASCKEMWLMTSPWGEGESQPVFWQIECCELARTRSGLPLPRGRGLG